MFNFFKEILGLDPKSCSRSIIYCPDASGAYYGPGAYIINNILSQFECTALHEHIANMLQEHI